MSSSSHPVPLFLFLLSFSSALLLPVRSTFFSVSSLPGFPGTKVPFHMETGYVVVDEVNDVQLFYYFLESERSPGEDPLILWLTGGPGCSALSGLATEIGPFKVKISEYNGSVPSLELNPYSWTKVSNVIFLDSPVGTGFSFSRKPDGYLVGDLSSSRQAYKFLRKWFIKHPKFLSNPLYIAGDSYAGKVVPVIAQEIAYGIEAMHLPLVNLKGYLIGNPLTGEKCDFMSRIPFTHGFGIISNELYEAAVKNCEGQSYTQPSTASCARDVNAIEKFRTEQSEPYILEPKCDDPTGPPNVMEGRRYLVENGQDDVAPPPIWCRNYGHYLLYLWANHKAAQAALRIQKGTVGTWKRCSALSQYKKDVLSSISYHLKMTSKGYRALVYSGDHDSVLPYMGTEQWIKSLNYPIVDDWRSWSVDDQVAGYTRSYANNLTFATVKGGGHTAPEFKPNECLTMLQRWVSHEPL